MTKLFSNFFIVWVHFSYFTAQKPAEQHIKQLKSLQNNIKPAKSLPSSRNIKNADRTQKDPGNTLAGSFCSVSDFIS